LKDCSQHLRADIQPRRAETAIETSVMSSQQGAVQSLLSNHHRSQSPLFAEDLEQQEGPARKRT
jgi:hypothetical protein